MAFISVSDAVERTGKGSTTIYRLCRKHEHTHHIKRLDNKFLIDEDFLSRHYESSVNESTAGNQAPEEARRELVDIFIEELLNEKDYFRELLDRKDEQLERKDQIITRLQERQKELHYLLNHQSNLLDQFQKPAAAPEPQASQQEQKQENPLLYEAKTVYSILAAVLAGLLLAILFVDEIRAIVE